MLIPFDLHAWLAAHAEECPREPDKPIKPVYPARISCERRSGRNVKRAAGWLSRMPGAVAGQRGHGWTLFVVTTLVRGFLLTRQEAKPLLDSWNQSCEPPWQWHEIEHKLDEAENVTCREPDGWMLTQNQYI